MTEIGIVALVLFILNLLISYKGFKDTAFYYKYSFIVDDTPYARRYLTIEDRYNQQRNTRQKEVDAILEKIHQYGIDSLTAEEKQKLQQYADR